MLLLNGETRTRAYSFRDKATGLLFGDAGSATLIESTHSAGKSFFSMNSDGSRADLIMIESEGYRHPTIADSLVGKLQPDGGFRSDEQGKMNGLGVFEFLISEVPSDLALILAKADQKSSDIDFFVLHQANRFMNEHLRKKMKIPSEKMPYSLDEFGNTSSVSIPLTMVTRIADDLRLGKFRLLLSGFGVGLSWGSAVVDLDSIHVSNLVECEG